MTDTSGLVTKPRVTTEAAKTEVLPQGEEVTKVAEPPKVLTKDTVKTLGGLRVDYVRNQAPLINALIYGESGVGKTTLLGSLSEVEELGPVVIINIEGGTLSIKEKYPDVEVVRPTTIAQMQKIYDDLYRDPKRYKTVCIDSLSELRVMFMTEVMKDVVAENSDRDPDVPGIREYSKNTEQVRKLVRGFRDLPCNTIFTALSATVLDKNNIPRTVPALTNKLTGEVPGLVDCVFYMYTKMVAREEKRLLLTSKTEREVAKDRSTKLPKVVEEPTFRQIYDLMYPK